MTGGNEVSAASCAGSTGDAARHYELVHGGCLIAAVAPETGDDFLNSQSVSGLPLTQTFICSGSLRTKDVPGWNTVLACSQGTKLPFVVVVLVTYVPTPVAYDVPQLCQLIPCMLGLHALMHQWKLAGLKSGPLPQSMT